MKFTSELMVHPALESFTKNPRATVEYRFLNNAWKVKAVSQPDHFEVSILPKSVDPSNFEDAKLKYRELFPSFVFVDKAESAEELLSLILMTGGLTSWDIYKQEMNRIDHERENKKMIDMFRRLFMRNTAKTRRLYEYAYKKKHDQGEDAVEELLNDLGRLYQEVESLDGEC